MTPSPPSPDLEATLCALALDTWKLLRAYERLAAQVSATQQSGIRQSATQQPAPQLPARPSSGIAGERLMAPARYADARLATHLESAGLHFATFEGQEITPQIPVVAINADDLGTRDDTDNEATTPRRIVVGSTLEPAIVAGARVLVMGRVIAQEEDA